jgi:hypothetical protein
VIAAATEEDDLEEQRELIHGEQAVRNFDVRLRERHERDGGRAEREQRHPRQRRAALFRQQHVGDQDEQRPAGEHQPPAGCSRNRRAKRLQASAPVLPGACRRQRIAVDVARHRGQKLRRRVARSRNHFRGRRRGVALGVLRRVLRAHRAE